jgi:hypothetical protein
LKQSALQFYFEQLKFRSARHDLDVQSRKLFALPIDCEIKARIAFGIDVHKIIRVAAHVHTQRETK